MKRYIILIAISIATITTNAQSIWNITYNMSVPMGETSDFISKTSFRGFGIDGRGFINENVTLGGSWNWNVFYEYTEDVTITEDNTTIFGNHKNTGNYMPIMFNAHYYFGNDGEIRPYIGTGVGTIWKEEYALIGAYTAQLDNNWQFGLTPEIGVFIPVGGSLIVFANAKYTYGVQTSQLTTTSYLNFGIGLAWENF